MNIIIPIAIIIFGLMTVITPTYAAEISDATTDLLNYDKVTGDDSHVHVD